MSTSVFPTSITKSQWITLHTYLNAFSCSTTPEILDLDWLGTIDRAIIIMALVKRKGELELLGSENSRHERSTSTRTNTLNPHEDQKQNHSLGSNLLRDAQTKSEEGVDRAIHILDSTPGSSLTIPNLYPRTSNLQQQIMNPDLNFVTSHQPTQKPLTLQNQVSGSTALPNSNPYHHSRQQNRRTSGFNNTTVPQPFIAPYKNDAEFPLVHLSAIQSLSPLSPSFGPRKGEKFKGTTNRRRSLFISRWSVISEFSAHNVSDKKGSKTTQNEGAEEERVLGEDIVEERERRVLWEAAWR